MDGWSFSFLITASVLSYFLLMSIHLVTGIKIGCIGTLLTCLCVPMTLVLQQQQLQQQQLQQQQPRLLMLHRCLVQKALLLCYQRQRQVIFLPLAL